MAVDGELDEECFSADSLEVCDDRKLRKKKKLKKISKLKKITYTELYQHRLGNKILKQRSTNEGNESSQSLLRSVSKCEVSIGNDVGASGDCMTKSKVKFTSCKTLTIKKSRTNLWSEFMANKFKMQHTKSEMEQKVEVLKKRLEYGRRLNALNKFNCLCLLSKKKNTKKLTEKNETVTSPTNPGKKATDEQTTKSKTVKLTQNSSSSEVSATQKSLDEIMAKLHQLKLRHQKDKKIVEVIRKSLKTEHDAAEINE